MSTQTVSENFAFTYISTGEIADGPLLISDARYFTGANVHAQASALWLQLSTTKNLRPADAKRGFLSRLQATGLEATSVQARIDDLPSEIAEPFAAFAAGIAEVLASAAIKGTSQAEIVPCLTHDNSFAIVWPIEAEVRRAVALLLDIYNQTHEGAIERLHSFVAKLAEKANEPSLSIILKAAEDRGIPWAWDDKTRYYQLGHGRHLSRLGATITGRLSAVGVHVARRKSVTYELLEAAALPVPNSILVSSAEEAAVAAGKIQYPLVIKPMIGHKGKGVTVGVSSENELRSAFTKARKVSRSAIVQQFLPGNDVRLLVVGKKFVAAAKRIPPQVIGDGRSTVRQLITVENERRAQQPGIALAIEIDNDLIQTLEGQGYGLSTVLARNAEARLRTVANWSLGGTAIDVTDMVHPDNVDMALRAAITIGIDVAGVDLITTDVSRPYYETGGAICEVNYRPGLRVHMAANPDRTHDIGAAIVESLIAGQGTIDIVYAIEAGNGEFASALAEKFTEAGKKARVACAYEAPTRWQKTIALALEDPDCDSLIINVPASAIAEQGTGAGYCRLAVNFGADIEDEAFTAIKRICGLEHIVSVGNTKNAETVLTHVAATLELSPEPRNCSPLPAEITTSRDLLEIAESRGIPGRELAHWNYRPLLQFGYGANLAIYRGRRTGVTSHIATRIADDKRITNALLRAHGLPHAKQIVVNTVPAAVRAAKQLGYPVIVKPTSSSEGRGISGNILNDDELAVATEQTLRHSKSAIVEPFLKGNDHRFLIVGGKAIHVTRHQTAQVIGDGRSTVQQLIAKANENPLRGDEIEKPYTVLRLDDDTLRMLKRQKLSETSVPAISQPVILSSICHLSTGATAVDVTEVAHPDNLAAAERIARLIDLDICGVDFLHPDVTKSYKEVGGVILEVNQGPSFDMHDASTDFTNPIRSLVLRELTRHVKGQKIPLLNCLLSGDTPFETVAHSITAKVRAKTAIIAGVAVPASKFALIGNAVIRSPTSQTSSICNGILADRRVEAAIFLTDDHTVDIVPKVARTIDFRSSSQRQTADEIAETVVARLLEVLG